MASTLEFANFTLVFGKEAVLADYLKEIVLPAFLDPELERPHGRNVYFILDAKVVYLGQKEDQPAIAGTFIKNTRVSREQVFDSKERRLVKDAKALRSSPSATFTLLLNNHRLLYIHDTAGAPDLSTFRATLAKFLMRKYLDFISRTQSASVSAGEKVTKVSLREKLPSPQLTIIPLTDSRSLGDFVRRYEVLQMLSIELGSVNAEIDDDDFFKQLRKQKTATGADKIAVVERKAEGLKQAGVIEQVEKASKLGNATIKFAGFTENGVRLLGSNDEIRLRVPIPNPPATVAAKAERAFTEFSRLYGDKVISLPPEDRENIKKIDEQLKDAGQKKKG